MRIVVLGAGAMGSLYGGYLSRHNDVTLVDIWQEHVTAISGAGLRIDEPDGGSTYWPKAVCGAEDAEKADMIIVFVKSTQTHEVLESARNLIAPETLLLTLQNGYGNAEDMLAFADRKNIIIGTTGHGCTMRGAGHIYHAGRGDTHIGSLSGDSETAERCANVLRQAGFETAVDEKIMALVWTKLFANIAINPITAILDLKNGAIVDDSRANSVARAAVLEAVAVANADGLDFNAPEAVEKAMLVAERTRENVSSMRADVLRRRPTEISRINGAVVKKAAELGISVPVNEMLTNLILAKENNYEKENDRT